MLGLNSGAYDQEMSWQLGMPSYCELEGGKGGWE
jgi:hypothetical protein